MPLTLGRYDSPVGPLAIATDDDVLLAIDFNGDVKALAHRLSLPDSAADAFPDAARPVLDRLEAYFAGDLAALDRIAVRPAGTPFQRRVWDALRTIRVGTTSSYRDLAVRIGSPSAVRAVGAANGANPIPIVVPCHRVIGTNGALVGYGGGLDRKRWLLAHVGIIAARLWD
jgi:methylated-DNA-[protein]-cysteine S-methyltransferase